MTTQEIHAAATCYVRTQHGRRPAYADRARVLVYDHIAGGYTTCHSLTDAQVRYVRSRTPLTDSQLLGLEAEAAETGDTECARIVRMARAGSARAIRRCRQMIAAGRGYDL